MIIFFHRVQRRTLLRRHLAEEVDWDNLRCFNYLGEDLLENDLFTLKTSFRNRALSAVKEQINVEKKRGGVELALMQLLLLTQTTIPFSMHVGGSRGRYMKKCCGTQPGSVTLSLVCPFLTFLCCLNSRRARVLSSLSSYSKALVIDKRLLEKMGACIETATRIFLTI